MRSDKLQRITTPSFDLERLPFVISAVNPEPQQEQPSIPFSHYLWVLKRDAWKMIVFILVCLGITFIASKRIDPIFESATLINVDRSAPSGVIGQESSQGGGLNDADQFMTTQIAMILSDAVLRPVALQYHLLEHEHQIETAGSPEAAYLLDAPVTLKNLKVARQPNSLMIRIAYQSTDRALAAKVANAIAQSYLEQTLNIHIRSALGMSTFMEKQIDELRGKMEKSSHALSQFERELGLINPEEKTNILSARLLQLNTEYTNAQAERVRKQAIYNSAHSGIVAAAKVTAQGESLARFEERVNVAKEKFAETSTIYGPNNAEYRKADNQLKELTRQLEDTKREITQRISFDYAQSRDREDMLQKAVLETKTELDRLNQHNYEYMQLRREAEADKKLYEELVRKIKEAGINAGFQGRGTRIADLARPAAKPLYPKISHNLLLVFLLATVMAIGSVILRDVTDTTLKDPDQVARILQTEVIGMLPAVKSSEFHEFTKATTSLNPLGVTDFSDRRQSQGIDSYAEAIRTLRNSILLRNFDNQPRSLLFTSAIPGEGKSMTSLHLAVAHAHQGKKTLIIDADLRRPTIHKQLGLTNTIGLSDALTETLSWRDVVIPSKSIPDLHIIPSGPSARRASDLIGQVVVDILDEAAKDYELIIIDAPPLLGFAEPLQMATAADGVIVVTRAGKTSYKMVATVLATLGRLRANVLGIVLNQLKSDMGDTYYSSYDKYYQIPNHSETGRL